MVVASIAKPSPEHSVDRSYREGHRSDLLPEAHGH